MKPSSWDTDAIFYHIYPLGCCGAPVRNDFSAAPVNRLDSLYAFLDHIQSLGANAIYLGPLFESSAHGYDTADYFQVDRRLGKNSTLSALAREIHQRGMHLVLDGVFNHVGRDFWAFRDLQANRQNSAFRGWFSNLDFSRSSPKGDPFWYEGWNGHYDLVKLNLNHPEVRSHLFEAIRTWVDQYEIDGLRLDAADVLDIGFLKDLSGYCRSLRPDFWLMGEIVHGDYRRLANPEMLNSATNYEVYKGLYSSLNDHNYFEIAYAINRQSGAYGLYKDLALYNFADNHDVDRIASSLRNPAHLYPLYCLLFTMPGIPSIYYGSEQGIQGKRTEFSDRDLRPALTMDQVNQLPEKDLPAAITRLAAIRKTSEALKIGDYLELMVSSEQFVFLRRSSTQAVVVAINSSTKTSAIPLRVPLPDGWLEDRLNPGRRLRIINGRLEISLPSCWAMVLDFQG
ncbi:MAG TPA: alpha-amylase family glycosyl hydrolase [Anaerolineaceae bacterium]